MNKSRTFWGDPSQQEAVHQHQMCPEMTIGMRTEIGDEVSVMVELLPEPLTQLPLSIP